MQVYVIKNRRGASQSEAELGLTGVDCITLRQERRIKEAPIAYKPIQSVIDVQVEAEMVDVVARLSPVLMFKPYLIKSPWSTPGVSIFIP